VEQEQLEKLADEIFSMFHVKLISQILKEWLAKPSPPRHWANWPSTFSKLNSPSALQCKQLGKFTYSMENPLLVCVT
jgi:hypothetical protein